MPGTPQFNWASISGALQPYDLPLLLTAGHLHGHDSLLLGQLIQWSVERELIIRVDRPGRPLRTLANASGDAVRRIGDHVVIRARKVALPIDRQL